MKTNPSYSRIRHILIFTLSLLLALAVVSTALPQSAQAAVKCVAWYTVKEGDRTPYIAHTFGLKWGDIAKANNLEYPWKLKPGQRLCIPDLANLKTLKTKPTKGSVTVTSRGNLITVTASGFPKKGVSIVKIRDGNASIGGWYKLGRLNMAKKSTSTGYYVLPKQLKGSIWLQVCLKNASTDEKICRMVFHRYK